MLASDLNNPEFANPTNPDRALAARFHIVPVKNEFETQKQGRPIFSDVTYIEIFTPGSQLNVIDTPARDDHKARFPMEWAHFQNQHGGDAREIGTPLKQWPLLTASQVEELRGLKFFTVDAIANASDQQINKIGMAGGMSPYAFREKARRFLQLANDDSVVQKASEELQKIRDEQAEKDAKHAQEMEEMRAQIQALAAAANNQETERKKPGRKPRTETA
jgi:hypothetical protein